MLLHVAANNVSIRNVKVSKRECHIIYAHVMCTLRFVRVYVLWLCTLCDIYILKTLELLRSVQLRFVTLRHVTFRLCCFMLCSNIFRTILPTSLCQLVCTVSPSSHLSLSCTGWFDVAGLKLTEPTTQKCIAVSCDNPVLEFLNNLWGLGTE